VDRVLLLPASVRHLSSFAAVRSVHNGVQALLKVSWRNNVPGARSGRKMSSDACTPRQPSAFALNNRDELNELVAWNTNPWPGLARGEQHNTQIDPNNNVYVTNIHSHHSNDT
jgi:hypothetical protein